MFAKKRRFAVTGRGKTMRIIDADALGIGKAKREVFENPAYADGWNSAIEIINSAPTLTLDDIIPHGRWLNWKPKHLGMEYSYDTKECSECGHTMHNALIIPAYYCPHCGAKMLNDNPELIGGSE